MAKLMAKAVANSASPTGSAAGHARIELKALLAQSRPLVMGVLNITPDSFSDGGQYLTPERAIARAQTLIANGADILDIGAESTRPYGGAQPISAQEELERLQPVLAAIVALGVPVSIDTMKAAVAEVAINAGAAMVNDVWGLQRDPDMAALVARHNVAVVIMHNRDKADPALDIIGDITAFFTKSLAIARQAGVNENNIVLDPGIGFGKNEQQSLDALGRLGTLKSFGRPLLVGASRKRFINFVSPSDPQHRLGGSIAAHLMAVANGASIIRTHDVAETVQALRVAAAIGKQR